MSAPTRTRPPAAGREPNGALGPGPGGGRAGAAGADGTREALLELRDVVKHYGSGPDPVRAVDSVSMELRAGEMVALLGPSGSGKTTLLLLVATLIAADAGEIRFAGRSLAALSEAQRSDYLLREVGFIYQGFHLMPRVSALENAARKLLLAGVGLREAQARVTPWLERLGLGAHLDRTPAELSGGERQRVAIARALAGEPRMVLADEPTGSLDSARSAEIADLLAALAHERGAAILLVTHDAEVAARADRRLTLRDGRALELGRARRAGW